MDRIKVFILLLSWSLYYVFCDFLIDTFESPYFVGMALRIGTVFLMTIYLVVTKKFCKFVFGKLNVFIIIGVAFLTFLFDCIINIGLQFSTASSGSALLKTEMLFVLLISVFQKKIILKPIDYALALLITIGSILIICEDIYTFSVDIYSLLFIISAIINSVCAFLIQKIQLRYNVSSFQIAYTSNIVSLGMYSLIFAIITNNGFRPNMNSKLLGILFACVLCQTLLVLNYYNILGLYPVWMVKTLLLIIPVITLFLQIMVFRIYPSFSQIIGVFITILSAMTLVLRQNYSSITNL